MYEWVYGNHSALFNFDLRLISNKKITSGPFIVFCFENFGTRCEDLYHNLKLILKLWPFFLVPVITLTSVKFTCPNFTFRAAAIVSLFDLTVHFNFFFAEMYFFLCTVTKTTKSSATKEFTLRANILIKFDKNCDLYCDKLK